MTTTTTKPRTAAENELAVLCAVHHFGYLRQKEVGRAAWPLAASANSSQVSAHKICKRLLAANLLKLQPDALGGECYVITETGASRLTEHGHEARNGTALNTTGPTYWHRTLGIQYLLHRAASGCLVWGEYAIDNARAPVSRASLQQRFGKLPDGFVETRQNEGVRVLDWIEIENTAKGQSDVERMLNIAAFKGQALTADRHSVLGDVVLVYDTRQNHEAAIVKGIASLVKRVPEHKRAAVLEAIVLVRCTLESPLAWRGCESVRASQLVDVGGDKRETLDTQLETPDLEADESPEYDPEDTDTWSERHWLEHRHAEAQRADRAIAEHEAEVKNLHAYYAPRLHDPGERARYEQTLARYSDEIETLRRRVATFKSEYGYTPVPGRFTATAHASALQR